jgi:hypothetical protein
MADTYRITPQGPEFMVSQNAGVTVGVYNTKQEAQVEGQEVSLDSFAQAIVREVRASIRDELNWNLTRQETLSGQARIGLSRRDKPSRFVRRLAF